jgi:hypothetical protein
VLKRYSCTERRPNSLAAQRRARFEEEALAQITHLQGKPKGKKTKIKKGRMRDIALMRASCRLVFDKQHDI